MISKIIKQTSKYTLVAALSVSIGATGWAYWNFENDQERVLKKQAGWYGKNYQKVSPVSTSDLVVKTKKSKGYEKLIQYEDQKDIIERVPSFFNFLVSGESVRKSQDFINLTNHPADDTNPIYSPDGKYIAFLSNREGNKKGKLDRLFLIGKDSGKLSRLTNNPAEIDEIKWKSPSEIEGHRVNNGIGEYFLINIETKKQTRIMKEGNNKGDFALDFNLEDLAGNKVQLSDYRGKMPVVINLWETWCGPCKIEMPSIQKFSEKYNWGVKVLALTTDDDGNTRKFIEKNKYTFTILIDKEENVWKKFKGNGIPLTYIIDKKGRIVYKHAGATNWENPEKGVRKTIDELLANY